MKGKASNVMITIDPGAQEPPFEQIKEQVSAQRTTGEMPAGHRLPPVRQLATELGLAPNTVARAYRELEAAGVIETRGRHGSFIVGTGASAQKEGAAAAAEYVARIRALGLSDDDAVSLIHQAL